MTYLRALLLVAAVLWSVFAFVSIVFTVPHCNLLQTPPAGGGPLPTPNAAFYAARAAECNQPRTEAMAVFGAGYVLLAVLATGTFLKPRTDEPVA